MHPTYVAAVERGEYNVTIGTLRKITGKLGITLSDAIAGADAPAAKPKRAKKPK